MERVELLRVIKTLLLNNWIQIMKNNKPLFVTDIVDGSRFRKLRSIRYTLYSILLIYSFVYFVQLLQRDLKDSYMVHILEEIPVSSLLMLLLLLSIGFIFYLSYRRKSRGVLEISKDGIVLSLPEETLDKSFKDIERLKITRGSTYHYNYQEKNPIVKVNNFIEFEENGEKQKFEFEIDSLRKNEMFEEMIDRLSHDKIQFDYRSI